jgi:hypothetical protein
MVTLVAVRKVETGGGQCAHYCSCKEKEKNYNYAF